MKKNNFHYFTGKDVALLKFPNAGFLNLGSLISKREFKIITLTEKDLNSEQIAEELFISPLTVHTHRSNLLKKLT